MTGGQMAPTTLVCMKSSTCPYGRDVELHGYPLKITEIAAQLEGTAYVTRQSVQSVPAIRKAKKAIRKAFENSMNGKGSNLVEIVSTCSSGWKMTPETVSYTHLAHAISLRRVATYCATPFLSSSEIKIFSDKSFTNFSIRSWAVSNSVS